jgi:hypothetical protein
VPSKPKPKKSKQGERRKLEKKLWSVMSLYVRKRDGVCVTCGCEEGLTMSHYINARCQILRYNEYNCNAQCKTCNFTHNYWPHVYEGFMRRKYGAVVLDELESLYERHKSYKWTVPQLQELLEYYQGKLEELE